MLIFLPGGAFQTGGINSGYYSPTSWIERSQSHIVITINYRVNIFGFPNAPGLAEQNLGILDQRIALGWVRDNIAAFGGDPHAITQWGQSAGSMSSDIHAHAFPEDPIARAYFLSPVLCLVGARSPIRHFQTLRSSRSILGANLATQIAAWLYSIVCARSLSKT